MVRYALSRVAWSIVAIFVLVVINFILIRSIAGDPVQALVGDFPASPEYVESIRHMYGLDRSMLIQLWSYLSEVLIHGNFGYSFAGRAPVLDLIISRSGYTLLIMVPGLLLASVLGVWLSVISARNVGSTRDVVARIVSLVGYSTPVFWSGVLLLLFFSVRLGWLPSQGAKTIGLTGFASFLDLMKHLLLPVICTAAFYMAVVARVGRPVVIDALREEYIVTARTKGLNERNVVWRHGVRSVLSPILTIIGFNFGQVLTGAILCETVFGWPGVGTLFMQAINDRDYPVLEGMFVATGIAVIVANLAVDLATAKVDPRIMAEYRRAALVRSFGRREVRAKDAASGEDSVRDTHAS